MKNYQTLLFLFLILLLLAEFFGFGKDVSADTSDLFISEVAVGVESAKNEFIEIKNVSSEEIDLKEIGFKLKLVNSSGKATTKEVSWFNTVIEPKGFFLFGTGSIGILFDAVYSSASLTGKGGVIIADKNNLVIDETSWTELETDETLERTNYIHEDSPDNWQLSYVSGGTPGEKNSEKPTPKNYSDKIVISEILPNPDGPDSDLEFIEFYNSSEALENLENWKLRDKNGKLHILENKGSGLEIEPKNYLIINPNDYGVSLHNSADENIALLDPDEKEVSEVSYKHSEVKENISYNFDGQDWHWSRFLTPSTQNKFNNLPEISKKKDKKIYAGVYADFSANGYDKDKDELKFTWDFDDGHKSYKKETRHKFKKAGKYTVTLKVSDGSEDKIETFNIKVEKFTKSKVKIVSLSPNPKGKDSDSEFITLQNKSKRKINLKDWSVATGSKKLYNHPITENIVLKPGKIITLTRDFSKFTLNNKKATVELRYPDGKVASKLAYDKKKTSIKEDEIYTKESGAWAWVAPKIETKLAVAEGPAPIEAKPHLGKLPAEPEIILASGQNFSENKNLRKIALGDFSKSQGMVLGAATFKPTFSETYQAQNKTSYLEIIFTYLNSATNYFLNKLSFFKINFS